LHTALHFDPYIEARAKVDLIDPDYMAELVNAYVMDFPGSYITESVVKHQMAMEEAERLINLYPEVLA
jgi:hypothetical protein